MSRPHTGGTPLHLNPHVSWKTFFLSHTHTLHMSQAGYIIAPPLTINYHGWWVGKILSWLRWLFGETVVRGNDAGKDDGGGGLLSCVLNHGLL